MITPALLVVLGFACLIFGGNWLVDGASALAKRNNISDLVIGLTIVSFGTSAPELVVNSMASFDGHSDIVFGNIIGSNNFNLFVILGISALIYPITVQTTTIRREIPISLVATLVLLLLANDFFIDLETEASRIDGVILLLLFLFFLYYVFMQQKVDRAEVITYKSKKVPNFKIWSFIILGVLGLMLGGRLVVDKSVEIATKLGVSQKIIGLTIVALGTSLPELVTSVIAAIKKNSDIAIGNVIGSNIFNILLIVGVSAIVSPINFSKEFNQDIYILIGGTVFLIRAMFMGKKGKLDRWEAFILLAFYLAYTTYLVSLEM